MQFQTSPITLTMGWESFETIFFFAFFLCFFDEQKSALEGAFVEGIRICLDVRVLAPVNVV